MPLGRTVAGILDRYRAAASACTSCRAAGLLHLDSDGRWSRPLFHEESTDRSGIVFVFEAPNFPDTYDPAKGRMTCDPETDPSGRFMYDLLAHVGLTAMDVVFTNAVLCLPAARRGKYPVRAAQRDACLPWLSRLVLDLDSVIVVTCGAAALDAANHLQSHGLTLGRDAGMVHDWYGRKLLPLYHPSALGRISRPSEQQLADIESLLPFVRS